MNAFRDAPFGPADRLDLESVPLAVIRHEGIRLADLPEAFDAGYSAIALTFAGDVLVPTGPALAVYHGDPMGVFDLELGFPVQTAPANPIPMRHPVPHRSRTAWSRPRVLRAVSKRR